MNKENSSSKGIGFTGLLFLVFLVLKLTGVVDWSWVWVTAPLWGVLVLCVAIILIPLIIAVTAEIVVALKERRK